MAQPNFPDFTAITDHLQLIQKEVDLASNMPAITNQNPPEQKIDAINTLIEGMQGQIGEIQGQLRQVQNEYVSLSSFG